MSEHESWSVAGDPALWDLKYRAMHEVQKKQGKVIPVVFPESEFWERITLAELAYWRTMFRIEAEKVLQRSQSWCVMYAAIQFSEEGITGADLMIHPFETEGDYLKAMEEFEDSFVCTVYGRR